MIVIIAVLALGYLAWPFLSMYQLGKAVDAGDQAKLERKVDWPQLRTHLKTDLAETATQAAASFAGNDDGIKGLLKSVIGSAVAETALDGLVDTLVTAEYVAEASKQFNAEDEAAGGTVERDELAEKIIADPLKHLSWAFFTSPTEFNVTLREGRAADDQKVGLDFALQGLGWKLVRVIPPAGYAPSAG
ncbi:MAG: DUF2939 domain-containing protein [Pseudomonadota bacterium]